MFVCLRMSWKAELRVFLPHRALTNRLMELLFHEQISGTFEHFVDEIGLARIEFSCHFALHLI